MSQRLWFFSLVLALLANQCTLESRQREHTIVQMPPADVWVGTYTRKEGHVDGKAAGIYHYSRRDTTWQLIHTTENIVNPSFLTLSPDGRYLYAVSEIGPDVDSTGYVYAFAVKDGGLRLLNRQPTYSFAPCHVSIHPDGQQLYVANYVGGALVRYPVKADGSLGEASDRLVLSGSSVHPRQDSSHPHTVTVSPEGRWLMVADLGTDIVHTFAADGPVWKVGSTSQLPAGAGPRHLTFHPTAPYAYTINELNNTVTAFHYTAENGALHILAHYSTLPANFTGASLAADIHLTPDGQFLYASNRGHNSIAAFAVASDSGELTSLGHTNTGGDFPRNFVIHPAGTELWVANQNSDNVQLFQLDAQSGHLQPLQEVRVRTPVCMVWGN
jgi:6-phosphogluconolactonase